MLIVGDVMTVYLYVFSLIILGVLFFEHVFPSSLCTFLFLYTGGKLKKRLCMS